MSDDEPYPTDEFGRPDGQDYHYRIPLNDDRAFKLASLAKQERFPFKGRIVSKWDGFDGDRLSYIGIQTHDSKGHLKGLAEYSRSPDWEEIGSPGNRMRITYGSHGGTKIQGTFDYSPESHSPPITLEYETVVDYTKTEVKEAVEDRGDTWDEIAETIHWAKDDATEVYREVKAEHQRQCDHEHVIEEGVFENPNAVGYCEDCQAEIDENGELAW